MKYLLTAALLAIATPGWAAGWHFVASVEGGAEYWTFTNETGSASPRRVLGNEIWIVRSDEANELDANGNCDFNNCIVRITLDGQNAKAGEQVRIAFSNGEALEFQADGSDTLLSNFNAAGMGATNLFVHNIRQAKWVDVTFGAKQHRFSLAGSAEALDAIRPWLKRSN